MLEWKSLVLELMKLGAEIKSFCLHLGLYSVAHTCSVVIGITESVQTVFDELSDRGEGRVSTF